MLIGTTHKRRRVLFMQRNCYFAKTSKLFTKLEHFRGIFVFTNFTFQKQYSGGILKKIKKKYEIHSKTTGIMLIIYKHL